MHDLLGLELLEVEDAQLGHAGCESGWSSAVRRSNGWSKTGTQNGALVNGAKD